MAEEGIPPGHNEQVEGDDNLARRESRTTTSGIAWEVGPSSPDVNRSQTPVPHRLLERRQKDPMPRGEADDRAVEAELRRQGFLARRRINLEELNKKVELLKIKKEKERRLEAEKAKTLQEAKLAKAQGAREILTLQKQGRAVLHNRSVAAKAEAANNDKIVNDFLREEGFSEKSLPRRLPPFEAFESRPKLLSEKESRRIRRRTALLKKAEEQAIVASGPVIAEADQASRAAKPELENISFGERVRRFLKRKNRVQPLPQPKNEEVVTTGTRPTKKHGIWCRLKAAMRCGGVKH